VYRRPGTTGWPRGNAIFESILRLRAAGLTIVYSTHYMEEAVRLCDRVAVVDHGRVLALGTVDHLIEAHGGPASSSRASTATRRVRPRPIPSRCCRPWQRVRGTFVRLQASPMSRGQLLAGKALAAFVAILLVQALLLMLGVTVFGVRPQSWIGLAAALLSSALAFVGVMLTLASLLRTENAVGGIGPAVMMPMFLLGGAMIPSWPCRHGCSRSATSAR
jgi:hypothetical protein